MKAAILLALAAALPLSAATISISPATPKAGDSVVVTVHDRGGLCPSTATTAKLEGQMLLVDVATTPGGCLQGCPTIDVPVAYVAPAVTLPAAGAYTIEYTFTDCSGKRTVIATQPLLVPPSCAFDRSLIFTPNVAASTTPRLALTWCDPSFSPFPDAGQSATAYRIFLVREGEAPILAQEQSASAGTAAIVALTNHEAGARSAFVEAVMCNVTIAGCRDSFTIKSNVLPLDVAPFDTCSFGGAALCLGGRFSVTARYHTATGSSPANPVPMTKESGYFWFFGKDNAEVTVKIVDACSLSSTFWFFAAGMTDVGVDLTVMDTHTGIVRRYSTPAGKAFVPIQDTGAFACP